MATSYTSLLGLALPVTGELQGTWGTTVNDSITSLLDTAVAGTTTLSTDGDVTLSTTTGAANQARQAILLCSGARTAQRTITAPAQSKIYTVINATTGGYSVKLVGVGPTTGITIVPGESAFVAWNGSDFIKVSNTGGTASFTNVTVSGTTTLSGLTASTALALNASKEVVSVTNTGTGNNVLSASPTLTGTISAAAATLSSDLTLSGGTANGVAYLNGSKVLTTGSALTFNGSSLGLGNAPTSYVFEITTSGNNGLKLNAGTAGADQLYFGNTGGFPAVGTVTASPLTFVYNGSEQMRLTSTGLGIGTSSPGEKLEIAGKVKVNTAFPQIILNRTASSYQSDIKFTLNGTNQWSIGQALGAVGSNLEFYDYGASATRMTLDTSGNLGLGVTPSAWGSQGKSIEVGFAGNSLWGRYNSEFHIGQNYYNNSSDVRTYASTNPASDYQQYNGTHAWYTAPSGTAGNAISFTQSMTLDASGNLLVGATSQSVLGERLLVNGVGIVVQSAAATNRGMLGNFGGSDFIVGSYDSIPLAFRTGNTERARITSEGYFKASNTGTYQSSTSTYHELRNDANTNTVRIANTIASGYTDAISQITFTGYSPNTTTSWFLFCNDSTATRAEIRSNGGLANYSANDVNLSDRREKANFAPAKSYLDTICAIPVQTFEYIDQSPDDPGLTLGVVAQDVQAVAPELVMESNWGTKDNPKMRLSIYQTDLQYALMKCIQEQQALITALTARVAQLEAKP